jgi:hypothetical protein
MAKRKNPAAVELGRRGGKVTSPAKAAAARANGSKGGRRPASVSASVPPETKAATPAEFEASSTRVFAKRGALLAQLAKR